MGKAQTDGHLCTEEPPIYLDRSKPDAVLKLLKNTISAQSGFLEAQKRESLLCHNSQQPEHIQGGMNSLLTLPHCWALAGREVKGQTTLRRLTLTQHNTDTERDPRDSKRTVFASQLAERVLLRSLYFNASLRVFICLLSMISSWD